MKAEWSVQPSRPRNFVAPVYWLDAALGLVLALLPYLVIGLFSLGEGAVGPLLWLFVAYAGVCMWRPTKRISEHQTSLPLTRWSLATGLWSRAGLTRVYALDLAWRSLYQVPALWLFLRASELSELPLGSVTVPLAPMSFTLFIGLLSFQLLGRASIVVWHHLGTATFLPARIRDLYTNAYPGFLSHCSVFPSFALLCLVVLAAGSLLFWIGNLAGLALLAAPVCAIAWWMVSTSEMVPHHPLPRMFARRERSRDRLSHSHYSPGRGLWWLGSKRWVRVLLPVIVMSILAALRVRFVELPEGRSFDAGLTGFFIVAGCLAAWATGWSGPFRWSSRGRGVELLHAAGVAPATLPRIELAAGLVLALACVAPLAIVVPELPEHTIALYPLALAFTLLLLRANHLPLTADERLTPRGLASLLGFLHLGVLLVGFILKPFGLELLLDHLLYDWIAAGMVVAACAFWLRSWILAARAGERELALAPTS